MKNVKNLSCSEIKLVHGGYSGKDCIKDIASWTGTGATAGAAWGSLAGGVGFIPGGIVGVHVGAIGGSFACMGGLLGG